MPFQLTRDHFVDRLTGSEGLSCGTAVEGRQTVSLSCCVVTSWKKSESVWFFCMQMKRWTKKGLFSWSFLLLEMQGFVPLSPEPHPWLRSFISFSANGSQDTQSSNKGKIKKTNLSTYSLLRFGVERNSSIVSDVISLWAMYLRERNIISRHDIVQALFLHCWC